jgi:hypothetical protein
MITDDVEPTVLVFVLVRCTLCLCDVQSSAVLYAATATTAAIIIWRACPASSWETLAAL